MDRSELARVVRQVRDLVQANYVFPDVAATVSRVLDEGLAQGRYPADARALALAVTSDLQSINGDKHLRLLYHDEAMAERPPGDDEVERAAFDRWAKRTCGGLTCVQRLSGNVGYLDFEPVLFPAATSGEMVGAAVGLLADTDALIIDLRACIGGDPDMSVLITSYLWNHEPVQLTGLRERADDLPRQAWTLPFVPGRRFGKEKPAYVLTSAATFSGGEQLSYDLQHLGRATIVGERTRGGAHAREGFRVHPHLEATVSVAVAVDPWTGGNWEGTGVAPDVEVTSAEARDTAHLLALEAVIASGRESAEATDALAALLQAKARAAAGG